MKKGNVNIYKQVAESLIKTIKEERLMPWQSPWIQNQLSQLMPENLTTGQEYGGYNTLFLWRAAADNNYSKNVWLTYRQAQAKGYKVISGSRAVWCSRLVVHKVKPNAIEHKASTVSYDQTSEEDMKIVKFIKHFALFNVEQLDNYPKDEQCSFRVPADKSVEVIDNIFASYQQREGLRQVKSGGNAYYDFGSDLINLPSRNFVSAADYVGTLAHEMVHSTGHSSRLNRFDDSYKPSELEYKNYAYEELIAEMGAAFLCAKLGIAEQTYSQHASYLDYWLEFLEDDYRYLGKAASAATKACNYILGTSDGSQI